MRGCFVTGTDTGVGKTVVSAALAAALVGDGEIVAAFKPAVTGLDEDPGDGWPADHELLAAITGQAPADVSPHRFGPPCSPHLAAALSGRSIDPARLVAAARGAARGADVLVVEGVGGLLVPLAPDYSVRDFASALALALIVVARPGLGTINHTLLTVEAARAAGLSVAGVVLTPWPGDPSAIELSNRETIEGAGVEVQTLAHVPGPDRHALARAGSSLPLTRWLG
jgi:dethiobiotin synthetase